MGIQENILLILQSVRLPFLIQVAALVSALGNYGLAWIVLGLVMIFMPERRNVGITVVFTVVITGIIVGFILQPAFAHIRPYDAGIGINAVMGVSRSGFSFPSFHATTSFAAATVIAMIAGRRWGMWSVIGATLISLSRLYLGVEWPLDVLVGALLGVIIGVVCAWIYNQFLHDIVNAVPHTQRASRGRTSVNSGPAQRTRK